jgi:hypothetical protein
MKTFFYMKRNPRNISGVSYKIWKIERKGRKVTTWWAPAECTSHKVYPARVLRTQMGFRGHNKRLLTAPSGC